MVRTSLDYVQIIVTFFIFFQMLSPYQFYNDQLTNCFNFYTIFMHFNYTTITILYNNYYIHFVYPICFLFQCIYLLHILNFLRTYMSFFILLYKYLFFVLNISCNIYFILNCVSFPQM